MKRSKKIKVVTPAPGKQGKREYRFFRAVEDAASFFERNADRLAGVTKDEQIVRKLRVEERV